MKLKSLKTSKSIKLNLHKTTLLILFFASMNVSAFQYCVGTVKKIISRDATEATWVMLDTGSGDTGYAKIGDGTGYNEFEKVQISLLISAYMSGQKVRLELNPSIGEFRSCTRFNDGVPVRYVMLDATLN